jgi:two-component system LytT family response regulator
MKQTDKPETMFTAMIVDDEGDARELLASLISEHADIQVIEKAESVSEAVPKIIKHHPDLLFLDIQMPNKSGFDLLAEIRELRLDIPVIFVTAYDQFAIQAIKASALDYLMKPVDPVELAKAIQKFRHFEQKEHYQEKLEELLQMVHQPVQISGKIRFNNRNGYILFHPDDMIYLEADANYTHIYLRGNKKETVSSNIGSVEKILPQGLFQRINRSIIINSAWLCKVDRVNHICILECDGTEYTLKSSNPG